MVEIDHLLVNLLAFLHDDFAVLRIRIREISIYSEAGGYYNNISPSTKSNYRWGSQAASPDIVT